MQMRFSLLAPMLFGLLFLFNACAYKAVVPSTSVPVSEIRADKRVRGEASLYIDSELADLNKDIRPVSYICSAHTFPLNVGDGLKSSILKVLNGTFDSVNLSATKNPSNVDGLYKFIFTYDSFQPSLRFSPGFWQANIFAKAEIVIKVKVIDRKGEEIVRTTISGEGSADAGGQCRDGAELLAEATQKALKRTLENFVYKVINSDYLQSPEKTKISRK